MPINQKEKKYAKERAAPFRHTTTISK